MSDIILKTENLTKHYGGVHALVDANFEMKKGEHVAIMGDNGAGKSTFFKCVTGLLTPTEGHVYMRGQEVTGWQPHQIASLGVGIKTQTPNVMDALSVHENVWLAARRFYNIAEARDRADAIIERLALSAIARTQLGQLAHGERQRVELGIVAVADPWLVLLDEPAAGMSAQDVDRMTEIIHELTRFAAVVIVEHDMQFIRSIAQTVTVFHQGAVLMEDNVERVMSDPQVRAVYLGKKA